MPSPTNQLGTLSSNVSSAVGYELVPSHSSHEGQVGYTQAGNDPHLHKFTWTNGSWRYDGCYGGPFTQNP